MKLNWEHFVPEDAPWLNGKAWKADVDSINLYFLIIHADEWVCYVGTWEDGFFEQVGSIPATDFESAKEVCEKFARRFIQ